jgi:hypothetical protein
MTQDKTMRRKILKMNHKSLDQFPNFLKDSKSFKESIVVEVRPRHKK